MTNQEMLQILKGDLNGKLLLFEQLTEKVSSGESLDDNEIPIFEALKKELVKKPSQIVSMEASVIATSGIKI